MKNNFGEVTKKIVVCGFCSLIMLPTVTSYICRNSNCPDYLFEKQEHIPEQNFNIENFNIQITTVSGTSVSNTSEAYGPISFIDLNEERG